MKREEEAQLYRSLALFLALSVSALSGPATATITTVGGVNPAYDSSDPWNVGGILFVGWRSDANASMAVSSGSQVTNSEGRIGHQRYGRSDVEVTGLNSAWTNSGDLYVGYGHWNSAGMTISDGGQVSSANGYAGFTISAESNVIVTGSNSAWENSANLYIGYSGYANVVLSDGGRVTNIDGYIGHTTGYGRVAVTGPTSHWENSGDLYVANNGDGELTISAGGKVTSTRAFVGCGQYPAVWNNYHEDGLQVSFAPKSDGSMPSVAEMNTILASLGGGTVLNGDGDLSGLIRVKLPDNMALNEKTLRTYRTGPGIAYAWIDPIVTVVPIVPEVVFPNGAANVRTAKVTVAGSGSLWENSADILIGGSATGASGEGVLEIIEGGIVSAQNVTIWSTGVVCGDSVLRADTVANSGAVKPGNSIGTLTVEGDLTMAAGSTIEIEIDGSGHSDKLVVAGDVSILGGTVEAFFTETIASPEALTIVEADGVDTTVAGLDCDGSALLDLRVVHSAESISLIVAPRAFDDPDIATTGNQCAVGSALQQLANGGGNSITTTLQTFVNTGQVRRALDQLSGQSRPSLAPVTAAGSTRHVGTVSNRLHNVRGSVSYGLGGGPLLAMARQDSTVGDPSTYDVSPNGQTFAVGNGTTSLADQKWGFWGKGYAVFGDRESESGSPGYQYTVYGTGFGFDYQFTDSLLLGITGGYSEGDVDYFSSRDTSDVVSMPLGIYGSWNTDGWYLDSLLSYAGLEYETQRHVDLASEKLSGDFGGDQISGYFEGGLNWQYDESCLIQPLASFQFSHLNLDSYTESGGASSLGYDNQRHQSHKGSLGMKLTKQFGEDDDTIRAAIELRCRWVHEFGDAESQVDAHFASDPGAVFTVSDEGVSRDTIVLGTGVQAMLGKNTRLFASYDIGLNADNTSHTVSAGMEHRW